MYFMWGSKQYVTLYGSSQGSDVSFSIKSDEQVLEWFETSQTCIAFIYL
jgi:hypothetical protein